MGGNTPAAAVSEGLALKALAPIALAALAAACTTVKTTEASLAGTQWQVTSVAGSATPKTTMYRLEFRDGQIGGRFGCNSFGGNYRVEGEQLITEDIASTLMGCPEPAATHETRGLAILARPMEIEWQSGQRITLGNSAGSIALERLP